MPIIIAAIRSGTDPIGPLPPGSFHRWLEDPVYCPKCNVSYNLVVDYDRSVNKYFPNESRRHVTMLSKAIFMGHATDHRITHFETNGVIVTSHTQPDPDPPLDQKPLSPFLM